MGALSDITVIDLTASFWASTGAALLADFGADVVRVHENDLSKHEKLLAHRNKRQNLLPGDSELHSLIEKADVFATDLPFAELQERGFDYEALARGIAKDVDGLDVLVADRALPAGDPSALGPLPAANRNIWFDTHGRS